LPLVFGGSEKHRRKELIPYENEYMMSNHFQVSPHTVFIEAPHVFSAAKDLHHTLFSNAFIGKGYDAHTISIVLVWLE
jgi:hypothetical protein